MNTNIKIAETIINQLGGKQFLMMTGSKNLVVSNNYLRMNLTKNKIAAKWLKITLNTNDLYEMHFFNADKKCNIITKSKFDNVYAEDLRKIFTEETGLLTYL